MSSYQPSALPNTRIDAADLLRGVAVAGIVMLHFIEHLNFYNFPPLTKLDNVVWNVMFSCCRTRCMPYLPCCSD